MEENNLLAEFDLRKIEFFFRFTQRGFVLLTMNEWHIMQEMNQYISQLIPAKMYDVSKMSFVDIVNDIKQEEESKCAIFMNFYLQEKDYRVVLDKFNLARDLLLQRTPYCVFIVPLSIELYIQEFLPNLYSYFEIKERFLRKFCNYFEYIFPESMYLKTKDMQKNIKRNISGASDDILENMDYYVHIKIGKEEFKKLKEDMWVHVERIRKSPDQYNRLFLYKLLFSFARIAIAQGEFKEALEVYYEILERVDGKFLNTGLVLEIVNGMADTYIYLKQYKRALEVYFYILNEIVMSKELDDEAIENYQIQIYSKMALCEMKCGNIENTLNYINRTLEHIKHSGQENKYFHIYYNYFIMYLEIYAERTMESDKMLKELEELPKDEIQMAMFLTVKAWYVGIIEGGLYDAIQIADEALRIKREFCIENDSRIAESHYVNALLRFFSGRDEEALHCCVKSINILKNFEMHEEQKKKSYELEQELKESLRKNKKI